MTFPALLGPLQILLFGTHTIYTGNVNEFNAPFWRLALEWTPALVLLVAGLIGCGLLLGPRWYRRYVVALFGLGLLTWLQGGLLLADYGSFTGEALDWGQHAWRGPYEVGLWVVGALGLVAATRFVFPIAPFASQLLVALHLVVLVGSAARSGPDAAVTHAAAPEFVFELSRTDNVIHIVMDGFQSDIFQRIIERDRVALGPSLSGFVLFADHAGAFRTTIASIPAMLTGHAYRNEEPIRSFIQRRMAQQSLYSVLQEHGFDTDGISIHRPGLESATNGYLIPRPYVSDTDYVRFAGWQLVDLSLFRHAPHALKRWIYNDQRWRLQVRLGRGADGSTTERRYHANNGQAFLEDFIRQIRVGRDRPVYKFLHVGIPHLPIVLDADCEFIGVTRATRASYLEQSTCAVAVVTRLLDRLRVLGVYDDSVIVISSDHGVRLTPEEFVYDEPLPFGDLPAVAGNSRALLAVKTANADGPLRISYAPTAITDIPVTIMDALGIDESGFPGESALRLDDDDRRERWYAWYPWSNADWNREYIQRLDLFSIDGRLGDRGSWTYRGTIFEPGTDLDDMSEGWDDPRTDADGERVRAISDHAWFYSPPEARTVSLELQSRAPLGETRTVTVFVNGEVVDSIVMDDDTWHRVEYVLPTSAGTVAARIDLQVDPPERLRSIEGPDGGIATRTLEWR